jgi:hypothetical protein
MSTATGEFAIAALSGLNVHLRGGTAKSREPRHTLTAETKPLPFTLEFYTGERMRVELHGSGHEPTSFWCVMAALKRLAQLAPSWDSYGARPLDPSSVRRFFSLLPVLLPEHAPEPTIIPTREGGIQFEWHRHGIDLEVKIPPSGPISQFFADAESGDEREWEGALDRSAVSQAFARMSQLA